MEATLASAAPHTAQAGPVMVIGSGLAGWSAVREFCKLDSTTEILMLTADAGDFYAKPSLSNAFAQGKLPDQLVSTTADKMCATLGVTLQPHTRVLGMDVAAQTVHTAHGSHRYRQLVLATGATPVRLALQGDAADAVLSVNSLDDYRVFRARLKAQARVLIIGAGLIGCEFANDLHLGGYSAEMVDPGNAPLAALLPADASAALAEALTALGVRWHWGTTVQSVDHRADPADAGLQVTLANGTRLRVDAVLSAVGLRADTTLAQAAGLQVERGVLVNARQQTSAATVFALGDNTQYAAATAGGVSRTLPYVMPIMQAAKGLALALHGTPADLVFGVMPVSVKTPALPLLIVPPLPASAGAWHQVEAGAWHFQDSAGQVRGFVLSGPQTARRADHIKQLAV